MRAGEAFLFCLHTAVASLASVDATFLSAASQVSCKYCVPLADVPIHQYTSDYAAAWGNGILESGNVWPITDGWNPNQHTVAAETEDDGRPDDQPITDVQYSRTRDLILFEKAKRPEMWGLIGHHGISPQSRSCPDRWYKQVLHAGQRSAIEQLALDTQLTYVG